MDLPRRPTLLSVGIVLTAMLAAFSVLVFLLVGVFGTALGAAGFLFEGGEAALPFGILAGAGLLVAAGGVLYHAAFLVACLRAWTGSVPWTVALIVFCAIGVSSLNFLTFPIYVIAIVGAAQSLGEGGYARRLRGDAPGGR